jgi:UDP-N-acetylglucosamine 2-epimerase (non-hydrolysing)
MAKRVAVVVGTRPEAIKMAPVYLALARRPQEFDAVLVSSGQHREMLDEALRAFDLVPHVDVGLMRPNQTLAELTGRAITGLHDTFAGLSLDAVLVHGDTTTTLAAALAAFYLHVPVGHVEAGLRTGDLRQPFPEEANRVLADRLCRWHFAPTEASQAALVREGISGSIHVTGNTVVDALVYAAGRVREEPPAAVRALPIHEKKRIILVTCHRRESFGDGIRGVCEALRALVVERGDVEVVFPVHLNPQVQAPVRAILGELPGVHLIAPQSYLPFVWLMDRADLLLTDSGGIQEEAPGLRKPVLVMRDVTERPEAVHAGTARLVGTTPERIVAGVNEVLDNPVVYAAMASAPNPFGDGQASERIANILAASF